MNKPRVSSSAARSSAASSSAASSSAGGRPAVGSPALTSSVQDGPAAEVIAEDYEAAVSELESLVERIEDGRFSLEESLAAYQRGVDLVRYCRGQLAVVEQKVKILEAGLLQPFEADVAVADDEDGNR